MKRALIIAVASLFVFSGRADVMGQASAGSSQGKDPISSIRGRYAAVNKNLAKYKVVKKELSGFSTEGGELTAYFDGPQIVKITTTNNGETNSFFEEFYYSDEKLIFVYRKQEIYDEPMSKVIKTKENRFYFGDGELIRWVNENGKQVGAGDSQYPEMRVHYLSASKLLTEGARAQVTVIEAPERNPRLQLSRVVEYLHRAEGNRESLHGEGG
jgi:hypothetical protein